MNYQAAPLTFGRNKPVFVSPHRFLYLVEQTLGKPLPESEQRRFEGCKSAQQFVSIIAESPVDEFLGIDLWKLAQIYVCLLGEFKMARINQKGYDALDAFEMLEGIEAGTVQVKHGGIGKNHFWSVKLGNPKSYSVLVFVGTANTRNPAEGDILVIPSDVLRPIVESWRSKEIPAISISKNKYHQQKRGQVLNSWWEYHLYDHSELRETVSKYVHGILVVVNPFDDTPMGKLLKKN